MHPNARGYRLMAYKALKYLQDYRKKNKSKNSIGKIHKNPLMSYLMRGFGDLYSLYV